MEELDVTRHPTLLLIIYSTFYSAVFLLGFLGNIFVVLSVILHPQLRSSTDYLISSLAIADLLIIIFCLPTTLLNNLLTGLAEWQLGAAACKMSTWINSTTSCASIFTLVAVTADRYLAICHTMKYAVWDSRWTLYVIAGIWLLSGMLAAPTLAIYDEILFALDPPNSTLVARLCIATQDETINFIIVNLLLAFTIPFALISAFYTRIFVTVSNHRSLAVDAKIRDERVKLRVAQMMLTVIIVFALCWLPLHGIYCYFILMKDYNTPSFQLASQVLRPVFQWLSLLSSSLNPLIYVVYSLKYRRAFRQLLLLPCRRRYERIRTMTQSTLRTRQKFHAPNENSRRKHFTGHNKLTCEMITLPSIKILSALNIPSSRLEQTFNSNITSI
ncbi:unnamed protein product [Thelazia callipaeda]|uniref:G_PROTEIN_RECEP_F1_2 domain-containing protein n=1 Tax=Thelazia callipaeda TaxID=103827 RepID=A0A0N5D5Z7_THECL|nr:unnamed protein product [Thelazia callipaeda]